MQQAVIKPLASPPPKVPQALAARVKELVMDAALTWVPDSHAGTEAQAEILVRKLLDLVAAELESREVSLISSLNSAAYHIGVVQRKISERRQP